MQAWQTWRAAVTQALYAGDRPACRSQGFYQREWPAAHFRTSAHVGHHFARAVLRLARLAGVTHLVDLGAGGGEVLRGLADLDGAATVALTGVDLARRPDRLPPRVGWTHDLSVAVTSGPEGRVLVLANEWLDDVPADVVEVDGEGQPRLVLVEPATGRERLGEVVSGDGAAWLARWWPMAGAPAGMRAELGLPRDAAWADVIATLARLPHGGVALAVDYGHTAGGRPPFGTLTGYRAGRQVTPVPDGSCDVTAHVAWDAVAAAGVAAGAASSLRTTQRAALLALGVAAPLPDVALARSDPRQYAADLVVANRAAELLDPAGLGGFGWLLQGVRVDVTGLLAGL
jgi:SAM-dependent MidA family methyltransferase